MNIFLQSGNPLVRADQLALKNTLKRWSTEPGGRSYRFMLFFIFALATFAIFFAVCNQLRRLSADQLELLAWYSGAIFFFAMHHITSQSIRHAITRCYGQWTNALEISDEQRASASFFFALRNYLFNLTALGIVAAIAYGTIPAFRALYVFLIWFFSAVSGSFSGVEHHRRQIMRYIREHNLLSFNSGIIFWASSASFVTNDQSASIFKDHKSLNFSFLEHRRGKWLGKWQYRLAFATRNLAMYWVYGLLVLGSATLVDFCYETDLATVAAGALFSHMMFMVIFSLEPWNNPSVVTSPIDFSTLLAVSIKTPLIVSLIVYLMFAFVGLLIRPASPIVMMIMAAILIAANALFALCLATSRKSRLRGNLMYLSATLLLAMSIQVVGIFGLLSFPVIAALLYRLGRERYVCI
ncbi:hypothetical protein ISP15_04330 [Dyella jejuensis]|uniref:Beta-carotene 15,15'-monooxygenase n=1 Tax=Dyella jejuensis TaxID=1432009 RepID=A0ABW8JEN7_9GAMM